jgi:hypothetical protein
MKKSVLAVILFLLMSPAFAQKRASRIIFNGGVQNTGMYGETFQSFQCFEGCFLTSQTPASSFDFNVQYQVQSKTPNLSLVYGIGINQKSWNGKGLNSNGAGPIDNPFSYRADLTYFGLFYGINYDFVVGNKTKLIAGTLINPEFLISDANDVFNSLSASIRMTIGLEYQAFDNLALRLTPYFQTAIMNYSKTPDTAGGLNSQNFMPYSFGVNLGIVLNRIAD